MLERTLKEVSRINLHWNLKAYYAIFEEHTVKQLSSKLNRIIDLLCDGNCHSKSELQKVAQLGEYQTRKVVAFLTIYGFVEMGNMNEELTITSAARRLFVKSI